jgi:chromosome segregation ATPase
MRNRKKQHFRKSVAGIALSSKMQQTQSAESIDIHVTELFGVQVLRKYVKNEQIMSDKKPGIGLRILLGALPVCMVLSTIICAGLMIMILYNPPPLVKELSENILMNFGKGNTLALEDLQEKLKSANDRIGDLKGDIERLTKEGLTNFAREEQLSGNLAAVTKENVALLTRLSSANESIRSLKEADIRNQVKIVECNQNLEICMKEKRGFQKSVLDLEKQERNQKNDLSKCEKGVEQLKGDIKKLQDEKSVLLKVQQKCDELLPEYEKSLKKCKDNSTAEIERINKKLNGTNNTLTDCNKSNANLTANLTTCQSDLKDSDMKLQDSQQKNEALEQDKDTLTKDLSATKFTLGNCKNKNMDHEVRSLELLQEIEGLKKELKAC